MVAPDTELVDQLSRVVAAGLARGQGQAVSGIEAWCADGVEAPDDVGEDGRGEPVDLGDRGIVQRGCVLAQDVRPLDEAGEDAADVLSTNGREELVQLYGSYVCLIAGDLGLQKCVTVTHVVSVVEGVRIIRRSLTKRRARREAEP